MARKPPFSQTDLKRAVKGVRAGGLEVGRVEIDAAGRIVLFAKNELDEPMGAFDKWKRDRDARWV